MSSQSSLPSVPPVTRRRFLRSTGAAAVSLSLMEARLVRGTQANGKINLGLIGCGVRGQWIANLFKEHGGYQFVTLADYFPDRALEAGGKLGVPVDKCHSWLNGYKRLLAEPDVDAVVIETPPYFHPEHAAAGISAGKHVYLAKPIAVDVPGCLSIEESARKARLRKLVFLVDFQTRASAAYQEAVKRVHQGDIGRLHSGEATYICGPTWNFMDEELRKHPNDPAVRLRAWGVDRVLSGDIITEQNIHALDVATWLIGAAPVKACGTGGRRRNFVGDCFDHFEVIYWFPEKVVLSFTSKQAGAGWDDICCRMFGMKGTVDTHYFGDVRVIGDDPFNGGRMKNLYTEGAQANIATFHQSVTDGIFANPTIAPSVRSNLTTILGRTAAYEETELSWHEMMKRRDRLDYEMLGLKRG